MKDADDCHALYDDHSVNITYQSVITLAMMPVYVNNCACILVQVTIYRRLRIGRDGHLDQSEAYDISELV